MADIGTISALLSSVKTATDIAKLVKDSGASLQAAEIKLNMAELICALADVKMELAEVQDELRTKDEKIQVLESELIKKEKLSFDGKMYWATEDQTPFCAICFEKDNRHHHLFHNPGGEFDIENWACRVCKNVIYI